MARREFDEQASRCGGVTMVKLAPSVAMSLPTSMYTESYGGDLRADSSVGKKFFIIEVVREACLLRYWRKKILDNVEL
jgi:hypothetical protein